MKKCLRDFFVGGSAVGLLCGGYHATDLWIKHYEAAFCQQLWEVWENPDRDRNTHFEDDPRIQELENYLYERGFWHQVFHEPPFGALQRFKDVRVEDYNKHCLQVVYRQLEDTVIGQIQSSSSNLKN